MAPSTHPRPTQTFDVIVIGTGAAGSAAALAAHEAGASVLLVEKCSPEEAGGNTRVSGGGWAVLGDEAEAATFLRALSGPFELPDDVISTWAQEMTLNSDWLRGLGADVQRCAGFHVRPEYDGHPGSSAYLGMDSVEGRLGDFVLSDFLRAALVRRGIPVRWSTPARALLRGDDGVVAGVRVATSSGDEVYTARGGVVLATGGFHANRRMVRDYLRLPSPPLWGAPHSSGDGHRMAQALGADLWHMGNMMTLPGIDVDGRGMFLSLAAHSYLFVNDDGRRSRNEALHGRHGQVIDGHGIELHPLHPALMIFDEAMRVAGPLSIGRDLLPVGWGLLMEGLTWSNDNAAEIADGRIRRADTVADLALGCGLDPQVLEETVATYNAACSQGRDAAFGRSPEKLAPLAQGPYYALEVAPMLAWTNGGPRRDGRARVIDVDGQQIPGLYAAGEVSSTYSWGKDGGFHIGDALAFGRVAGREAAARARGPLL